MRHLQRIVEMLGDHQPRPYSGRGMYGETCLGIETGNLLVFAADLIGAAREYILTGAHPEEVWDEVQQALEGACWDQMGLDLVVYFPSVPAPQMDEEG